MKGIFSCIIFVLLLVANADASYYTVKKGDNLYDIAKRFGTTTQAIKESNNLESHNLSIGTKLRIPSDTRTPEEPEKNEDQVLSRNNHEKTSTIHTIKSGENFYSISKKYGVTTDAIKKANKLSSHSLKPGTKLTIPKAGKKAPENENAPSETPVADKHETQQRESTENSYYIVKKGDSLDKIAKKQGVSKKELIALNRLSKKNLTVGQKLIVKKADQPAKVERTAKYKVKKGDTIHGIARKFDITSDEIRELNNLSSTTRLKAGQTLIVSRRTQEAPRKDAHLEEGMVPDKQKSSSTSSVRLSEVKAMAESEDISQLSMTDRLTLFAKKMLHLPYKFGGNGSAGLDCSAFVQKVYDFAGIDLPRSAREQYKIGEEVDKEELSIGDLVFFRTYASFPSHVGIYLGNNLFIHASSKSKKVTIDSLETPYYVKRYIGAKRLVSESNLN